jgi:hypothetical protein
LLLSSALPLNVLSMPFPARNLNANRGNLQ